MIRVVSGIVILMLLAWGIYLGGRWMMADVSYNRVMTTLDNWRDNRAVTSVVEWERMREVTEQAIGQFPDEPEYYRLMGLLYEWRGFAVTGEEVTFNDILASRRQAVNVYREAAHLRPAQPDGWAHLARMKILAGERDDEFRQALQNAIAQGRNDAGNLTEVAYIVSLSWGAISADAQLQQQVRAALIHGMLNTTATRGIINYLDSADLMPEFCPFLDLENIPVQGRDICQG